MAFIFYCVCVFKVSVFLFDGWAGPGICNFKIQTGTGVATMGSKILLHPTHLIRSSQHRVVYFGGRLLNVIEHIADDVLSAPVLGPRGWVGGKGAEAPPW